MPDNDDAAASGEPVPEHRAPAGAGRTPPSVFPPIRTIPLLRPLHWIALGWRDLRATGGRSLFYGLCFAAMGWLLSVVLAHAPAYLSALTCGFLLLGPFLALGLYDLSRRLEQRQSGLLPTLFSMQGRWSNIGVLAVVLAVVMMVWARASLIVFALFYNRGMPSVEGFLLQLLSVDNLHFITVYFFVGALFAGLVFAVSWVSIPLMLDRDTDAVSAIIISIGALLKNIPAALVWGLLIIAATAIGFTTWYAGLIVTMPLIGHATWHAYRDVVGPAGEH
ncbi:MAG: DUF2189 domain-containing protein [Oxalobacteraceae bacterium]|nr:DUF2189 domain-containing protein [Oxalobacteraceae bacterium]